MFRQKWGWCVGGWLQLKTLRRINNRAGDNIVALEPFDRIWHRNAFEECLQLKFLNNITHKKKVDRDRKLVVKSIRLFPKRIQQWWLNYGAAKTIQFCGYSMRFSYSILS